MGCATTFPKFHQNTINTRTWHNILVSAYVRRQIPMDIVFIIQKYLGKRVIDSIILNYSTEYTLLNLLSSRGIDMKKFNLIYKGTKNGFKKKQFDNKCLGKGPSLVLIQTTKNIIYGGYTQVPWSKHNIWKSDYKGFLFSIRTNNQISLPYLNNHYHRRGIQVVHFKSYSKYLFALVAIGKYEIRISTKCNKNSDSYRSDEMTEFFTVSQIEIFEGQCTEVDSFN
eukprot:173012_1